jgi:hypothetical protein
MKHSKGNRKKRLNDNLVENKRKVTKALKNKKIDIAIETNWPFIGPFLKFLEGKRIMDALKNITGVQIRKMLGLDIYVLLYILKIIIGIPTMRGSEALLGDLGAMRLVGFDVDRLKEGLCGRGDANQYGEGYKKNPMRHGLVYSIRQC